MGDIVPIRMPCRSSARSAALWLALLLTGILDADPAAGNRDCLYFECPCEFAREGDNFAVTAGLRRFRPEDSGPRSLEVRNTVGARTRPVP